MADDKKVFDVAKPGSAKPDTGSKPMVVGHKLMKDPTLTVDESEKSEDSVSEPIAQPSKVTISPLSEEFVSEKPENASLETTTDTKNNNSAESNEAVDDVTPEEETESDKAPTPQERETTAEEKKEAEVNKQIEQEENLQKIIREKTYVVPVEEASYSAFKTFIKTFVIVGLLGVIGLVLLVDAEIIDLGINLPFDLL
jgi:hypothetical protein